jgi:hypothetical protein
MKGLSGDMMQVMTAITCRQQFDHDWLHKAAKEIAKYRKNKRVRSRTSAPPPRSDW